MTETETKTDVVDAQGVDQAKTEDAGSETVAKGNDSSNEELVKLKSELARQKAAIDKATKEAAEYKRALRAKQSEEEIAAEEKKAHDEATQKELEDLRKEVAKAKTVKSVMSRLGTDEATAGKIAESLIGVENVDDVMAEIQKVWTAKEKALRLEFGKIPAPGAGGAGGEDTESMKVIKLAQELGRERAGNGKTIKDALGAYVR